MEIIKCPLCNMACTERKSIVCNGCDSTWYHEKSMGMPGMCYDKLSNDAKSTWELSPCQGLSENTKSNFQDLSSKKLAQLIDTLRLQKIGDAKDTVENPEDSLVMAAEIGSSLLDRVLQLEKQNSILQQQTANLSALVEELKNEVNEVREREAHLVETIDGINKQLDKEKAIRENLQRTFEEQDEKQEELIANYQDKICNLEKTVEKLNNIRNHNQSTDNDHDQLPCELAKGPAVNGTITKTDHEITNLLCKFKAVECRLSTLEKVIVEDSADIKADKILKKYLDATGVQTQLNSTNQVYTCEQNVSSLNQLGFECLLDGASRHNCREEIIGNKVTDVGSLVNEPAVSYQQTAVSLKPDNNQADHLSKQIDSERETTETLVSKLNKQVRIPSGKHVTQTYVQESNQPCAITYLQGEKFILGVNNKKKDTGIFKQGCRIFINPFTNKS